MKRLFLLLALCGMVAVGCTEGGVDDNIDNGGNNTEYPEEKPDDGSDIPDDAYITLNKEVLTFVPDGESVEVKVYSNYKWTLTNNCDWVTAYISGGEASEEGTAITLTADLTYDDREGTITFSCGKAKKVLVVSQSFKEAIIADENNVFDVPAEGGNVIINYQTNVECEVIIPEEAKSWISLAPETRGLESESATLTVAENTTYSERSAVVKVVKVGDNTLFAEYTINQVQNDAIIADENNTFNLNGLAQSIYIAYQTNVECEVVIPEEAKSWISLAPATRALVDESAMLNIAENNTGAERSAVVKVVAANNNELVAEYTITQNQRYFMEYTSEGGYTVSPYNSAFGATIIRNKYIDGKGYIDFDAPITSIGNNAFSNRTSLTSITIPESVTSIGDAAFYGCTSLPSITIPNSVTEIGYYAFANCTSLTSVTIPDSVTSIGSSAFEGCPSLTSITIPDSVTSIGNSAFYKCTSLTSITIPNSVTSIGNHAFCYCTSLTSVTIPDSVTSIGSSAFDGCTSLTSITIPDSVTSIGKNAFRDCTGELIVNCNIPSASEYYYGAFYGSKFTRVTIGDSVTSIGDWAFSYCTSLTSVYITDIAAWCNISFGSAYSNPLYYAGNLYLNNELVTDLIIPDSVTSIGYNAFRGCISLTSVTIPDSVTSIGDYAFSYCTSLTSVTIGNGVTSIGDEAFRYCGSLKEVYCKPTTPPTGDSSMFYGNASGRKIYVPRYSVEAYKSAEYWSEYAEDIVGYNF